MQLKIVLCGSRWRHIVTTLLVDWMDNLLQLHCFEWLKCKIFFKTTIYKVYRSRHRKLLIGSCAVLLILITVNLVIYLFFIEVIMLTVINSE